MLLVRLRLEGELHDGGVVGVGRRIADDRDVAYVCAAEQDVVVDVVLRRNLLRDISLFRAKRTNCRKRFFN